MASGEDTNPKRKSRKKLERENQELRDEAQQAYWHRLHTDLVIRHLVKALNEVGKARGIERQGRLR